MTSINGVKKREHILVAERAFGGPLPAGSVVHHVNQNKLDNHPENLVICPSEAYHQLLHRRMRALEQSGNASNRQCMYCKDWSLESVMKVSAANSSAYHGACRNAYRRAKYADQKGGQQ